MPERIDTAEIAALEPNTLESDDTYPGTYGFYVRLDRDPGTEWGIEFLTAYESAPYPGKPPVIVRGDRLCVFYLPRYADDLPKYLRFLLQTVIETNRSVEKRNSILPNEEQQKERFRQKLVEAAQDVRIATNLRTN